MIVKSLGKRMSQLTLALLICASAFVSAAEAPAKAAPAAIFVDASYTIQPGDVLFVSVWKEEDMQKEVLVGPDGRISFPLAGDLSVRDKTVSRVRDEISARLQRYIPEPSVAVSIIKIAGNKIFVVGQVNRPGEFVIDRPIDVIQALSMAGGTTPFADIKDIRILRRNHQTGEQRVIPFNYRNVLRGSDLSQNVLLKSGDTIMVP